MMAKNIGFTVEQINEMVELYNQGLNGDGSWSKSPRGIGYKFTVTGTEEMLIWIAEQMGLVPRLYERHPDRDNNNFTLEAQAKGDMKKAIDYLYEGATVYLDRKYATAVKIRPLVQ